MATVASWDSPGSVLIRVWHRWWGARALGEGQGEHDGDMVLVVLTLQWLLGK